MPKGGVRPADKQFYLAAKQTYSDTKSPIDNWNVVFESPTLDAWFDGKDSILIGVRGTKLTDKSDLSADASLIVNRLTSTDRYKRDVASPRQVLSQFPQTRYQYYLVGHSLGGAIINQLKEDFPFLRGAVEYNPAFQPYDFFRQRQDIQRIYTSDDGLYKLGGRFFRNNIVIPGKKKFDNPVLDSLSGHTLSNFQELYQGRGRRVRGAGEFEDALQRRPDLLALYKDTANFQFRPDFFNGLQRSITPREVYEARKPAKPYDKWRAEVTENNISRSFVNLRTAASTKQALKDVGEYNKQYIQYIKENPDQEEVLCNLDAELKRNQDRTTAAECKRRHKEDADRKAYDPIATPLLKATLGIGDIASQIVGQLGGKPGKVVQGLYENVRRIGEQSGSGFNSHSKYKMKTQSCSCLRGGAVNFDTPLVDPVEYITTNDVRRLRGGSVSGPVLSSRKPTGYKSPAIYDLAVKRAIEESLYLEKNRRKLGLSSAGNLV